MRSCFGLPGMVLTCLSFARVAFAQHPTSPPTTAAEPVPSSAGSQAAAAISSAGYGQVSPEPHPSWSAAPPPPLTKPSSGFEMPTWSVRLDPLNWLLDGRFGLELEAEVLSFLSVELVPVFIVSQQPPFIKNAFDEGVTQHSNGLGALSGTSLGVGFWLSRKALHGTVLRAIFTNYGMTYRSVDASGATVDELSHTERHIYGFLGSHSVIGGFFTIAGGLGMGVELNRKRRCFVNNDIDRPTSDCARDQLQLARGNDEDGALVVWNMHSWSHPVQVIGRFSLGVTF